VKAFVSYAAKDSSWIEDGVARELSQASGKKFYRVLTLMVLNPQLYAEAQKETAAVAEPQSSSSIATPSSSSQAAATTQPSAKAETPKIDYKKIATKTAMFLLGIARKAIGL